MAAIAAASHVAQAQQAGVKRTELQRRDLSMPGREVVQVRVDLDPGVVVLGHTHPGEEIIYVIEGTSEYVIGGKMVTAEVGDVLFVPAGTIHSARNAGTGNAAELATRSSNDERGYAAHHGRSDVDAALGCSGA